MFNSFFVSLDILRFDEKKVIGLFIWRGVAILFFDGGRVYCVLTLTTTFGGWFDSQMDFDEKWVPNEIDSSLNFILWEIMLN